MGQFFYVTFDWTFTSNIYIDWRKEREKARSYNFLHSLSGFIMGVQNLQYFLSCNRALKVDNSILNYICHLAKKTTKNREAEMKRRIIFFSYSQSSIIFFEEKKSQLNSGYGCSHFCFAR